MMDYTVLSIGANMQVIEYIGEKDRNQFILEWALAYYELRISLMKGRS